MQDPIQKNFILSVLFFFIVLFFLIGYYAYAAWKSRQSASPSPYTGLPLRKAKELGYSTKDAVLGYLFKLHEYDNRLFDLDKAAFCRDTGRIFPNAVTWSNQIYVDWNFLQKRYPGNYVSWGSLREETKQEIRSLHGSLEGFQTEFSSKEPAPRMIEPEFCLQKPGPLYVDMESKMLLGWKIVPGTELEVLIVQKPKKVSLINIVQ